MHPVVGVRGPMAVSSWIRAVQCRGAFHRISALVNASSICDIASAQALHARTDTHFRAVRLLEAGLKPHRLLASTRFLSATLQLHSAFDRDDVVICRAKGSMKGAAGDVQSKAGQMFGSNEQQVLTQHY